MNKKLMAVAVAGALAAPAMAFAQASTVQIYGLLNAEYGFVNQPDAVGGAGRHNADGFQSGASRIGFKGEEKLGSGMSAWFQCESDIRFLSGSTRTSGSWCDRNSAIGLKGGFGNFFLGTWDSPLKQAVAKTRILNETGYLGAQELLLNNTFSASRRNAHSINYVTPNMGGFSARAQITSTNAAYDQLSTAVKKGRILGLGADYTAGPLTVAVGWDKADDNRVVANATAAGAKDTNWGIGATYSFGPAKVGLTYTNQKGEDGAGGELKKSAWNLALDWKVTSPGLVRVGYTQASDYKGNLGGADTGAKQWQVGYNHSLSKRTTAGIAYVKVDNDSNGTYNLTGFSGTTAGDSASAVVMSLTHTF
jgi:predicted porin